MRRHIAKMQSITSSTNSQILRAFQYLLILVHLFSGVYAHSSQLNYTQTTPTSLLATDSTNEANTTTLPVAETITTSAPTTATVGELLLLKVDEFVDYTETPALLIDNLSEADNSSLSTDDNKTNQTTSIQPLNSSLSTVPSTIPVSSSTQPSISQTPTVTTINPLITTISENAIGSNLTTTEPSLGNDGEEESTTTGEGETAEEETSTGEPFEPPKNVTEYMDYIERLFHDFRHQITDLFEPHIPQLIRTSQMVELSGSCSFDMLRMALALRQFEPWALRMIDSSGKIPEGIFEGSFTALGSYDECLATVFSSSSSSRSTGAPVQQQQLQQQATQGKYCLVNVSPFLPPKPPADRVERLFQEEANRRNYTKDNQFSRLSPMFYYMKFRIGVCVPSTCLKSDMDSISSALSSSLRLNITVPHCRMKQAQPFTNQQLVAGSIFGLVVALIVGATMVDLWVRKLNQMSRREKRLLLASSQKQSAGSIFIGISRGNTKATREQADSCQSDLTDASRKLPEQKFAARLAQHWSWLSFSLLTNFKLYFGQKWASVSAHPSQPLLFKSTPAHSNCNGATQNQMPVIKCLDGIRVISLCWVILANSYVTLDPRATKLLSETRKAPKDFLFQLVVQASLAIETFFFLSGLLMSLSFANRLKPTLDKNTPGLARIIRWFQFYVHRYIRMTPATMLVIAFTMFAFRFGDGPLWLEATHSAHQSCRQNWWRHLLHIANFVDTRQMCFIHYWYIAADMQLFLVAPVLMFLLYHRRRWPGYVALLALASLSMGLLFYNTYIRNLPPTLLFYNSDPESRREYGNTIMTKPLTHAMPYMVGMLVGKWLSASQTASASTSLTTNTGFHHQQQHQHLHRQQNLRLASVRSLGSLFGLLAILVALAEVFLPYKWNNSHLPTRLMGSLYAALFRFGWSMVLAYLVISCRHRADKRCKKALQQKSSRCTIEDQEFNQSHPTQQNPVMVADPCGSGLNSSAWEQDIQSSCMCASGGSLLNRFLSLPVFTPFSKLSFVAYLIHLPLMSVFVSQTRGLFAFSHMLVLHLALSYLVMTFILAFVLVHLIEFPFITFERYLFERLMQQLVASNSGGKSSVEPAQKLQQHSTQRQQPMLGTRRVDIEDLRRRHRQTERC